MGRVRYGISNVYYAEATEGTGGALTYATPVAVPGAKSMSFSPAGNEVRENADNVTWYSTTTNNGYTGTIEFEDTAACDAFLANVLGHTVGTDGTILESANDVGKEFALLFQFELAGSTETGKRGCFYRVTASRANLEGQTKEDSITVNTNTVNFTALPRINDDAIKLSAVSTDSAYATWFSAVPEQA